uniref:J domain-containing protein n=1 Tax=Strongyloides papillosus TaxID=174720 RepID=A0A0N5C780_STREA
MGFKEDCETNFGSTELYTILGLDPKNKTELTTNDVKRAYYKKSLLYHPDKFLEKSESTRQTATCKFQIISKIYNILGEEDSKKAYDESGFTGEDDDNVDDWVSVWKKRFKPVSLEDIVEFLRTYTNSEDEKQDIMDAYNKHKGDLNKIIEHTYNYDVSNIEDLMTLINGMIEEGILKKYPKWKPLTKAKIAKMKDRKEKEEVESKKALEEIMKNRKEEKSLEDMILERSRKRGQDMIMKLEEKYCQPKTKKRKN